MSQNRARARRSASRWKRASGTTSDAIASVKRFDNAIVRIWRAPQGGGAFGFVVCRKPLQTGKVCCGLAPARNPKSLASMGHPN